MGFAQLTQHILKKFPMMNFIIILCQQHIFKYKIFQYLVQFFCLLTDCVNSITDRLDVQILMVESHRECYQLEKQYLIPCRLQMPSYHGKAYQLFVHSDNQNVVIHPYNLFQFRNFSSNVCICSFFSSVIKFKNEALL